MGCVLSPLITRGSSCGARRNLTRNPRIDLLVVRCHSHGTSLGAHAIFLATHSGLHDAEARRLRCVFHTSLKFCESHWVKLNP